MTVVINPQVVLERVTPETLPMYAPRLGAILSSLVMSGISNHFLIPFTATESTEIFLKNIKSIEKGGEPGSVVMWVAKVLEDGLPSLDLDGKETGHGEIVGSVQLAFHVSPNGRFRGEVRKLIVDERYQRRGVGRLLMRELENTGREMGITLCLLDTEKDSGGEKLYLSLDWKIIGTAPNYALTPDGKVKNDVTFMYKEF